MKTATRGSRSATVAAHAALSLVTDPTDEGEHQHVVVIRCTPRLLERMAVASAVSEPTTTILGDWYATPVVHGSQHLILLISERSRACRSSCQLAT